MGRASRKGDIASYLRSNPTTWSARDISSALGISYGTCLRHLNSLVEEGELTTEDRATGKRGRPERLFVFVS